jgi:probable rRNA maturation factor
MVPVVSLFLDTPSLHLNLSSLKGRASHLLSNEGVRGKSVGIVLSGNALLKKLNRKFRGKDKPTDVLSFSFNDQDFLGEIYLSIPRARAQAREYRVLFRDEIWRLIVHGLFHLLGYTHYRRKNRLEMEKKESLYL